MLYSLSRSNTESQLVCFEESWCEVLRVCLLFIILTSTYSPSPYVDEGAVT